MGCLPRFRCRLKFRRRHVKTNYVGTVAPVSGIVQNQDIGLINGSDDEDKNKACEGGVVWKYTWDDVQKLTMDFSQVIGSGGFSTVYLANLPGSILGAIKIQCTSDHLGQLFKQELDILLRLKHGNIVKLLGYCHNQDEGALVFEYVPNGTLQDKLHGSVESEREGMKREKVKMESLSLSVLSWRRRMAIAFQLAQALEYLHENCSLPIVHGDIKASNILLDENLNCKLCDFGSAKMGFSSTLTPSSRMLRKQVMIGSPGYTDPHYLRTGIPSKKNDVYSYGVIILELVTGIEAFPEEKGQPLASIIGPALKEIAAASGHDCEATKVVAETVDPTLGGDFDVKEAKVMLSIAAACLGQSPTLRPSTTQIMHTIKENIHSISLLSTSKKDLPCARFDY